MTDGEEAVEGAPPCRCTHRLARHDRDMACTEPDCDCTDYGSRRP